MLVTTPTDESDVSGCVCGAGGFTGGYDECE